MTQRRNGNIHVSYPIGTTINQNVTQAITGYIVTLKKKSNVSINLFYIKIFPFPQMFKLYMVSMAIPRHPIVKRSIMIQGTRP